MQANGETIAVWVSVPTAATFMFAARVAAVQIFWALKYHAVRIPEIDGYITYGSWGERERAFHGRRWRVCPVPLALAPRLADAAQVAALRSRFPEKVLLGTLAREEKIDSRPFLQCVVEILRRHPECGYLWTGRAPHRGIVELFREAGVGERCHFVGWVDTPLYAAALDVFLETFPLGCGITGYQALGAGVPLVSYLEPNTVFGMQYWSDVLEKAGSVGAVTREMLDEYPVLVARSKEEYVGLVSRLLSDEPFRARWAAREKAFYETEIGGVGRYSRYFFDTIDQIAAGASRA
jgi:predicted O-linked N-acetylglucosamine transferase (SPINDLY family)